MMQVYLFSMENATEITKQSHKNLVKMNSNYEFGFVWVHSMYLFLRSDCVKVQAMMNPNVITVEPSSSVALAAKLLSHHNIGALPVCSADGRLRGMVTDRDIILRCIAAEEDPAQTPVREIMSRGCTTISAQQEGQEAIALMASKQVRRLPVVDNGKLVGVLSLADIARSQRFDMEAAQALGKISENIVRR